MKALSALKHGVLQSSMKRIFPLENEQIVGFMSSEDSLFLYLSVLFTRPKSVLEIGHFQGKSTAAICQAIRDGNFRCNFKSFDLPFENEEEFSSFYGKVHQKEIQVGEEYRKLYEIGSTSTAIAQKNMRDLGFQTLVDLQASDFRKCPIQGFDLIFADVLHEEKEIRLNLDDIVSYAHPNSTLMFDDVNKSNIELIEQLSDLKFIRQVGKVGYFNLIPK